MTRHPFSFSITRKGTFLPFVWILGLFAVAPVIFRALYVHVFFECCITVLLLFIMDISLRQRWPVYLGLCLGLPFIILDVISVYFSSVALMIVSYGIYSLYLVWVILFLGREVFGQKLIDTNLIFGAILIYLLAGILWSKLYWLTETVYPQSFTGVAMLHGAGGGLEEAYWNEFDLLYYSFTIITSVGLGDVVPVHHLAKSFTMLEAIFGQLFVAIAIAKMVSIWRTKNNETTS